jgi:hypothetical protein
MEVDAHRFPPSLQTSPLELGSAVTQEFALIYILFGPSYGSNVRGDFWAQSAEVLVLLPSPTGYML